MELDEMKSVWQEMSGQLERQKKLTDKLIMDMTQQRYHSTLSRIKTPELFGAALCIGQALLILINAGRFNTPWLSVCAVASFLCLLAMPALSIGALYALDRLSISNRSYREVLTEYTLGKRRFLSAQKVSFYLGFVLLIAILPVMVRIMDAEKDIRPAVWFWYLPFAVLFFALVTRWVYRYYSRTALYVETMLTELNSEK